MLQQFSEAKGEDQILPFLEILFYLVQTKQNKISEQIRDNFCDPKKDQTTISPFSTQPTFTNFVKICLAFTDNLKEFFDNISVDFPEKKEIVRKTQKLIEYDESAQILQKEVFL